MISTAGCLTAYQQAVLRRVLDLAQATVVSWNASQTIGSIICSRALLETLATFHSLLSRAQIEADKENWDTLTKLVNSYAFSTSPKVKKGKRAPEAPPPLGPMVREFSLKMGGGAEKFWDQICEVSHPNGESMLSYAGSLKNLQYELIPSRLNEERFFTAIYNCLYSCCWFFSSMLDFDILLEKIRNGSPLVDGCALISERELTDKLVQTISEQTRRSQRNE